MVKLEVEDTLSTIFFSSQLFPDEEVKVSPYATMQLNDTTSNLKLSTNITSVLVIWNIWKKCHVSSYHAYQERRQNLNGRVLVASTVDYFPTTMMNKDTGSYYGLSIDILHFCQVKTEIHFTRSSVHIDREIYFQDKMNFTVKYTTPKDNAFGNLNTDGTWNGCIRQIHDGQADMA